MKGIILAGGTGSRLDPISRVTNKHLLPVGRYPMIYYPVFKLKEAGIYNIMIVTGKEHAGSIVNLLGSGADFNLKFTYRIQDKAGGIAEALGLAEEFSAGDKSVVILGDNIFEDSITDFVKAFSSQKSGAKILIKEVSDPERYGVPELNGDNIVSVEEKPKKPKSNYSVTGIYMFDKEVYKVTKNLKPSKRGELEITDVINYYIKQGTLTYNVLNGWWTDAGTFPSLAKASQLAESYWETNQINIPLPSSKPTWSTRQV